MLRFQLTVDIPYGEGRPWPARQVPSLMWRPPRPDRPFYRLSVTGRRLARARFGCDDLDATCVDLISRPEGNLYDLAERTS